MKKEKERVICAIPKEDIYHNADNVEGKRLSGRTESDLQAELSEKAASLPEAEDCSSDLIPDAAPPGPRCGANRICGDKRKRDDEYFRKAPRPRCHFNDKIPVQQSQADHILLPEPVPEGREPGKDHKARYQGFISIDSSRIVS